MELKDRLFIPAIRNTNSPHISSLSRWLLFIFLKHQPNFHNISPQDSQDTHKKTCLMAQKPNARKSKFITLGS